MFIFRSLSDCCCCHLFVYQGFMNWMGMLHISLRGVNGRLWCSHLVFTGHTGCSGLSDNILAGEINLGGGSLRESKNRDPFAESFKHTCILDESSLHAIFGLPCLFSRCHAVRVFCILLAVYSVQMIVYRRVRTMKN